MSISISNDMMNKTGIEHCENFLRYFDFIGSNEIKYIRKWYLKVENKGKTQRQREFLIIVGRALSKFTGSFYIANIEPSLDTDGKLYYEIGAEVATNLTPLEWRDTAREFAPKHCSDLATLEQLVLWYAYRIAKGCWTINYVCDDSSSLGNYTNSKYSAGVICRTGALPVGGASDGVGNTRKIVIDENGKFYSVGGCYTHKGGHHPVMNISNILKISECVTTCSGVLVLNNFFS